MIGGALVRNRTKYGGRLASGHFRALNFYEMTFTFCSEAKIVAEEPILKLAELTCFSTWSNAGKHHRIG